CFGHRRRVVLRVAARASGSSKSSAAGRRVYRQSQGKPPLALAVKAKEIASSIVPASAFVAATFEDKASKQGIKWSFVAGTNLLSGMGARIERESKQKLN
ncbi:hypothetical protein RJ641_002886, partial [Dillenia turbinata]